MGVGGNDTAAGFNVVGVGLGVVGMSKNEHPYCALIRMLSHPANAVLFELAASHENLI